MIDHKVQAAKKMLDDYCGTQAEMGDASLGIMGIMGILRIMGIVGGVMRYPVGLSCRCVHRRQSAECNNK